MSWVNVVLSILILLVLIGILICTHELGHLAVAKAFGVYCFEYSVGFGPRLFKIKRKGWETEISLRALPLGGYVSMYGESMEAPEGETLPPASRSLEGISPWKRILVMLAGITVNLFTAVLFAFIYATCIPSYITAESFDTGINAAGEYVGELAPEEATARAYSLRLKGSVGDFVIDESEYRLFAPIRLTSLSPSDVEYPYLLDSQATIKRGEEEIKAVMTFLFETVSGDNDFVANLAFYKPNPSTYITVTQKALGVIALPDANNQISLQKGDEITAHIRLMPVAGYDDSPSISSYPEMVTKEISLSYGESLQAKDASSLKMATYAQWDSFGTRLLNGCYYIRNFFVLIGQAFAAIFMGNLSSVGSIVAAGAQISTLTHEIGVARTFFFYGGFLSLNLAIFNLLPFPGLDGYQVLVVAVEKIFKKKIPPKVKNIISYVGLGLLLLFSGYIIIRDIIGLF